MYRILILSHGKLCEGVIDTLRIFLPDLTHLTAIPFYTEGTDAEKLYRDYLDHIQDKDTVVVFTDLLNGSVHQKVMNDLGQMKNIHIIAGFNLCAVFDLALKQPEDVNDDYIRSHLPEWREGMIYMKDYSVSFGDDDE